MKPICTSSLPGKPAFKPDRIHKVEMYILEAASRIIVFARKRIEK